MGQRVGKFEIVEELGRGGMGVVYKAMDPAIGRTVALKVLPPSHTESSELRERFLREARAAGRLQHPNIVVIHDLGEDNGNLYIAMEYLEGETLAQRIARGGPPDIAGALDVMAQVARGLHYAHERGVVHRDIKPANILVTREGMAKILDFGIARAGDQRMTKTGQVMGTIFYMSPEQINGQVLDGRSDVFSAGIVLYELLTGDVPFEGESTGATMMKILTAPAPPLGERAPMSPPVLEEVVTRALAKQPAERYANAAEFATALEAAKGQCPKPKTAAATVGSVVPRPTMAATVLHDTPKPASGPIELKEFTGWKDDDAPAGPRVAAAAAEPLEGRAALAPAVGASGPQTRLGEAGWKWWHLFWPSGDSVTAGKVGCRFSAGAALLFALLSLFAWFVQTVDPTQADHPGVRLFFGAYGVAMALCGAFLLRYSRIAAFLPPAWDVFFISMVLINGKWSLSDVGPALFLFVYLLVWVPGVRGSLLYHRLCRRNGLPRLKMPFRGAVVGAVVYALIAAALGVQYRVALAEAEPKSVMSGLSTSAPATITIKPFEYFYEGTFKMEGAPTSAAMQLYWQQKDFTLGTKTVNVEGCGAVYPPLDGGGKVTGTRTQSSLDFTMTGEQYTTVLHGEGTPDKISGTFEVRDNNNQPVRRGKFELEASKKESLPAVLTAGVTDCPSDSALR